MFSIFLSCTFIMFSSDIFNFRRCFEKNQLLVAETPSGLSIDLGTGSETIPLLLSETTAEQSRSEMKRIIFGLYDTAHRIQKRVTDLENENATLRNEKLQNVSQDSLSSISAKPTKVVTRNVGMSSLNPGSKKRKTAKGVNFD